MRPGYSNEQPEHAVDIYYTLKAGAEPGSDYVKFAAANMTGANRLLIGTAGRSSPACTGGDRAGGSSPFGPRTPSRSR